MASRRRFLEQLLFHIFKICALILPACASVYHGGTRYTWGLVEDRVLDLELQVAGCEQLLGAEN